MKSPNPSPSLLTLFVSLPSAPNTSSETAGPSSRTLTSTISVLTEDLNDNRAPRGKISNRPDRILEEVHNHELQFKRIPLHQYLFRQETRSLRRPPRTSALHASAPHRQDPVMSTGSNPGVSFRRTVRTRSMMSAALCVSCSAADRASVHLGTSKFPIFIINLIPVR